MENQVQTGDNMVTVTYDKDRKTVTFYDTFVDINGDVIKYDDIAVIQSGAMDHSFMYYIVFGNSFTYNFDFTTYDGNKHKFKRYGLSVYGIGTTGSQTAQRPTSAVLRSPRTRSLMSRTRKRHMSSTGATSTVPSTTAPMRQVMPRST